MSTPLNNGSSYLPSTGEGSVPQWTGTYAATVVNNADPLGVGRLQLNVPMVLGNAVSPWAVPSGSYFSIPSNGTTVSCVFLGGDPAQPAWSGPLDLSPIVEAAAPPTVTYSPSSPPNPRVHDIWYETVILGGNQFIAAPQVWTFNSMTSTFSWVPQGGVVDQNNVSEAIISASVFEGTDFIINTQGEFYYAGAPAAGNLSASVVPGTVNVHDPSGNLALPGMTVYQTPLAVNSIALNFQVGIITFYAWNGIGWGFGAGIDWSPATNFLEFGIAPIRSISGSAANPTLITTDSWHKPGSLSNGWTLGSPAFQYRLLPTNELHIVGLINSASMSNVQFFTLPYGFSTGFDFPVAFHTSTGFTQAAFGRVDSSGDLSIINATTSTGVVVLNAVLPLDVT